MERGYRKDIDGLRAIAVLVVVFYHFGLGFSGGFVGVDVFFVISGYLIAGIIKRDLDAGTFTLAQFWERRIRRIVPAATVVLVLTIIGGYLFLLSADLRELGKSVLANAVFSSNVYFWRTIDYFTDTAASLPLLHTWSLAVEEQFYLVFPFLLLVATRLSKGSNAAVRFWGSLVFALSLAASCLGVFWEPQATFYLLPTRAWELLLGVGINYWPKHWLPTRPLFREVTAWLGVSLILVAALLFTEGLPFPGPWALLPCVGAFLVIIANESATGTRISTAARVLSLKPLVTIGLVSYSLYLLHWPVLVFARYMAGGNLSWKVSIVLVVALLGLSWLSLVFIEKPIRSKRILKTRASVFAFAGIATLASVGCGLLLWMVVPSRYAVAERTVEREVQFRVSMAVDVNELQISADQVPVVGAARSGQLDLLLLGDSHARMAAPAFEDFCKKRDLSFASITYSSTQPLVDYSDPSPNARKINSIAWMEAAIAFVKRHRIGTVVLAAKWDDAFRDLGPLPFAKLLERTVERFQAIGATVYLTLDVPTYSSSVPRRLIFDSVLGRSTAAWVMSPSLYSRANQPLLVLTENFKRRGVRWLDPRRYLLDESSDRYRVSLDGAALYYDNHHLTISAAKRFLGPMLEEQLILGQTPPPLTPSPPSP